jgi:hypothetical protein
MLALGLDRAGGGIAGYFGLGPVPDRGHPPAHRRTREDFSSGRVASHSAPQTGLILNQSPDAAPE